jgi:peptidoglycan/xylan/chitin deacetylase (PgdA/CDA1 family)
MQNQSTLKRRWQSAIGLCSCLAWGWLSAACSGPKLTPSVQAAPVQQAMDPSRQAIDSAQQTIDRVKLAGGRCGPDQLPSQRALPEASEAAAPGACAEGAPPSGDQSEGNSPVRPLGVGYPGAPNALPPHVAYLTFDDGPSEWTETFLKILKDKGVPATFFVTAKQLKGEAGLDATYQDEDGKTVVFRDVLKHELEEGHQIANHTVNHIDLAHITPAQITSEIDENELLVNRALVRAGGKPELLTLFRPPYGSPWYTGIAGPQMPEASQRIANHGLNIMWTVTSGDATDWAIDEGYSSTSSPILAPGAPTFELKKERVQHDVIAAKPTLTGDGMIVLMHDTHSATRDVLPAIIDGLRAQGYTFETIEHYVQWRWNRPSLDLAPGPWLYQSCVPERDWGCEALGDAPLGSDRASEVCGRMWVAYHALGGAAAFGAPLGAPERSEETGIVSQAFAQASIELHPENPPPCNMIAIPR